MIWKIILKIIWENYIVNHIENYMEIIWENDIVNHIENDMGNDMGKLYGFILWFIGLLCYSMVYKKN